MPNFLADHRKRCSPGQRRISKKDKRPIACMGTVKSMKGRGKGSKKSKKTPTATIPPNLFQQYSASKIANAFKKHYSLPIVDNVKAGVNKVKVGEKFKTKQGVTYKKVSKKTNSKQYVRA